MTVPLAAPEDMLPEVRRSLATAESRMRRIRRNDRWSIVATVLASLASTIVAGVPAAANQPIGGKWRTTCIIVAACSAIATAATALRQAFGGSDRLVTASACLSRLKGLEFSMVSGLRDRGASNQAYVDILEKYAEFLA